MGNGDARPDYRAMDYGHTPGDSMGTDPRWVHPGRPPTAEERKAAAVLWARARGEAPGAAREPGGERDGE